MCMIPLESQDPLFLCSSRGTGTHLPIQSNEAVAFRWMSGLINHLHMLVLTWKLPSEQELSAIAPVCIGSHALVF